MFHFFNSFIFNLCTKLLKTANGESLDRARDFGNIDQKHKVLADDFLLPKKKCTVKKTLQRLSLFWPNVHL